MECNKEEAKRAMELATKKMKEHDFDGAERMIAKAVSMDPDVSFPYWIPKDPYIWRDPVNVEANEARDSAEERFKEGDYNGAISMIDKAKFLNPDDPNAVREYANRRLAYSIHLIASSYKTADGSIDWHAVLGVSPSEDYKTALLKYRSQLCCIQDHGRATGCTAIKGAWELTRLSWIHVRRNFLPWKERPTASKRDKEEARMALDLAEDKFKAGDYEGAMCMAGRAGSLDPDLPGTEELEAVYRVHYANAKFKTADGETDWYAVLGVDPSLDLDTIVDRSSDGICELVHPAHSYSSGTEEAYLFATRAMIRIIEEREPEIGSQPLDPTLLQPMMLI